MSSTRRFSTWTGAALLAASAASGAGNGASYVGAERCKLCHWDVHRSWVATPHARATLSVELASEKTRCLACHATAGGELEGVQCEACHGPGSNYSQPEVMIDPEKARMAGLVRSSIVVCERCHENDEPDHLGALGMPPSPDGDYWKRWVHEMPLPEEP